MALREVPVRNLLAAAESVGDDEGVGLGFADGGKEHALADLHGDLVVLALVAEGAGEAAATGVEHLGIEPGARRE